jgi:hypothetical protein
MMTEAEWLANTSPKSMLEFLQGKSSDRKLRLFACACCRLIWPLITHESCQDSVDVAERFADGDVTEDEMSTTHSSYAEGVVYNHVWPGGNEIPETQPDDAWYAENAALEAAYLASGDDAEDAARNAADYSADAAARANPYEATPPITNGWRWKANPNHPVFGEQAALLRDIHENPFRSVSVDPSRLTSTVVALARGIYDDRAFDRLPILADALQDAGCENADILTHLRGDGPHVRGCWALDLILGKQ